MALHIARNGQQKIFSLEEVLCYDIKGIPTAVHNLQLSEFLGNFLAHKRLKDGRVLVMEEEEFIDPKEDDHPGGQILFDVEESKLILTSEEDEARALSSLDSAEQKIKGMSFEDATGISPDFDSEYAIETVISFEKVWGGDVATLLLLAMKRDVYLAYKKSGVTAPCFLYAMAQLKTAGLFDQWVRA